MEVQTTAERTMNIRKVLLSVGAAAGIVAFAATNASAAIVCAGPVCWHTHETYDYPADARVTVHPDDWRWGREEHYTWREHEGRGYWRGERWMEW
jgi:hypothetical protein